MKKAIKLIKYIILIIILISLTIIIYSFSLKYFQENKILKQVINRLEAESRIAEVLVTDVKFDEKINRIQTTIKFLEYDVQGNPLPPRYFTFLGNLIQFQSLVIRFDDIYIRRGDRLRGKSVYIFWKAFMLDGKNTQEYEITKAFQIPQGYKIEGVRDLFEEKLWHKFWEYALHPEESKKMGIKNAQIEAPGTMFVPGTLYTIKIEHDGGMRIDVTPLPTILKGELIPK